MNRENQEGSDIGAFLVASLLHFYSGQPLQNHSGVDTGAQNREIVEADHQSCRQLSGRAEVREYRQG